jgi:vacuolar-type H+-ATPase subunit C/Vma6
MIGLIARDPLGIGVVLGYVALKENEVNNIHWIAQGINIGLKADVIREEVEFLP